MTQAITQSRPRAADLLASLSPDHYRRAYDAGMNLSLWLEQEDPSEGYNDGLDAFERVLKAAGLRTRSRPEIGLWASTIKDFEEVGDHARALVPEVLSRFWRRASFGRPVNTRAVITAADDLVGGSMRPYADAMEARWTQRLSIPVRLADITAVQTPVDSDAYRAYYLTDTAAEQRMVRVAEGAEIPTATITGSDNTIRLRKYGRALEQSYEAMRRVNLDKVARWVERLAIRNEADKISAAIKTLVAGDGNNNAAINDEAKTDFDSTATGKAVTLKAYLNWKLKWYPDYRLTHLFATEADMLKIILLDVGGTNTASVYLGDPTAVGNGNTLRDGVTYGLTTDVPTDKIVGLDASAALEHVMEVGSDINEIERWARRQTETIVMSVVEGFAVFDKYATRTLELEA